jgi:hypothetical protein
MFAGFPRKVSITKHRHPRRSGAFQNSSLFQYGSPRGPRLYCPPVGLFASGESRGRSPSIVRFGLMGGEKRLAAGS